MFVINKRRRLRASHDVDELLRQFERGCLKIYVQEPNLLFGQHEPEVDVNDVAVSIQHDVTVMPVFDLQDVAHQGIGGHAHHKIVARFF